jgi:hypothetical protein
MSIESAAKDALDNVDRIPDLERDALLDDYARRGEPVILTSAFASARGQSIATLEAATSRLGDVTLRFRPEYGTYLLSSLARGPSPEGTPDAVEASFADYWRMVEGDPQTPVMCVEETTPKAVAALFPPPQACASEDDLRSTVFIGNAGNVAPIHFDGDCRHVLLHQVFGHKLVVMLPVTAAPSLRAVANFSTLQLRGLDPERRKAMVAELGGWECVLAPGETVLMPALVWHGVVYLEHGMSVNFRFGRHRRHHFVSEHLHLDELTQRFAALTLDPATLEPGGRWAAAWRRLVEAWAEPSPTAYLKYLHLRGLLGELLADVVEDAPPELGDDGFEPLPQVVVEALLRGQLFNQRLYLHRTRQDVSPYVD